MTESNLRERAIQLHREHKGKIEMVSKIDIHTESDLSLVYTPGVGDVCKEIEKNPEQLNTLTSRGNSVAVVTDGTAVLGLGDIGPGAAMPVMEGKCMLFKKFADINASPICLDTKDVDEIVAIVKALQPTFAGINLEDISAPRCFEIEKRLKEELDIPVFHDDQHGTAIVVLAGLLNSLKVVGKHMSQVKVVINGAGAAGISIAKLLLEAGFRDLTLVSLEGIVHKDEAWLNPSQKEMAVLTNKQNRKGRLKDAIVEADVFIGVSGPAALKAEEVKLMAADPIVFAMANPIPEIYPEEALSAGAKVIGTGRSDYPNQINNLLAFPGIFRGAIDSGATDITIEMKIAAAYAIANVIPEGELAPDYVIPHALNEQVADVVAKSVADEALKTRKQAVKTS
ncbi:NADP-dependent malic enzyme [Alkalihalophilus pseudofirmus]|uniref:NADP-dependent malic enzyme n=1 Tax=Alkalihalophilus pseudofirmus TaxID=79885 RepID=A0AAJ2KZP6_ALKPS|nr:NADP-dependent malic enzyme [Alkalihalophilus pseudofirmus]MDV2884908.1 NADP-dependent malic enzyme [Alkalihalophilus pseudofirmus]WEG19079.1 NADP-dependent malic enzyme [Alkalihalophilus pseudofirmus]